LSLKERKGFLSKEYELIKMKGYLSFIEFSFYYEEQVLLRAATISSLTKIL
jgi:hypothetical protein